MQLLLLGLLALLLKLHNGVMSTNEEWIRDLLQAIRENVKAGVLD